jgi:DNA-directed RNA polymerase subunit beta'
MRVGDIKSIKISLASPEDILSWSYGEVIKPETINYRTQRPEKDGLFCERIFGPEKDYQCYCGKYKRIRYKGIICDRCGVEVTKSSVRRERMGHIKLATPVSHIWFLRGVPSRIGMVLDVSLPKLEKVIYFAAYIITKVDEEARKEVLKQIDKEYKLKIKSQKSKIKGKRKLNSVLQQLKTARDKVKKDVLDLEPLRILSEVEYHSLALKYGEVFEAGMGAETIKTIFEKIDLKSEIKKLKKEAKEVSSSSKRKILRRLKLFQSMQRSRIRPEWMFLTVLPVLPPDLRPMVQLDGGRYASSDLNDLYRRVINRNNRLKYLLEISAPKVIVRNEKRMLQEAVDSLIDNGMRKGVITKATTGGRRLLKSLADMLKGKQGRFRQNLLGKRVDYSGRSVIVVGPKLKFYQCGLPKKMALELFKPFVINQILEKELAYNVRAASRLIEQETEEVWAILEKVVKDKLVLLNRAPTLHRLGIQAFQPVLIEGGAIQVHPLVCKAFNADFDGDQMAVHLPLSIDSQKEASEIMLSSLNLLKPATGTPVTTPTQDIILGCYLLTRIKESAKGEGKVFANFQEALLSYEFGDIDLRAKIKVKEDKGFLETSVGRIVFNETLPGDHRFINEVIDSKKLDNIISWIVDNFGVEKSVTTLDRIKSLGFNYATILGVSWGMDDLVIPDEKEKLLQEAEEEIETIKNHYQKGLLTEEEKYLKAVEIWQRTKSSIEEIVPKALPESGPVFSIVDSGAKGSWVQPVQMCGMKGLVINPVGQIIELPIKSSYKEGFNILEYFISTHGARKGTVDTALRTSTAGYLTRRLIDVAHEVIISEEDCRDKKGTDILREDADKIGQNFAFKILGRAVLEDVKHKRKKVVKKGEIIDWERAKTIIDAGIDKVKVRSPLSCKSLKGICQKCYGWNLGSDQLIKLGESVGIVAAQAIGEPGTQLTMRTFHTGGVAKGGDITFGLPRVEEIFEVRKITKKGVISRTDGKVVEVTKRLIKVKPEGNPRSTKKKNVEYKVPSKMNIWVKRGDKVKNGQQLSEGRLDLKELFKIRGKEETQRHIIKQIQQIYVSQGAIIHDKHLEVIIRQMFSRMRIRKTGDSSFVPGETVEQAKFLEENNNLKKENKELATGVPILLGISRVALTTDSFLSAASFQETTRVLIKAAIEGKEDQLRGLKENVIIGKLIPAGTGFEKEEEKKK